MVERLKAGVLQIRRKGLVAELVHSLVGHRKAVNPRLCHAPNRNRHRTIQGRGGLGPFDEDRLTLVDSDSIVAILPVGRALFQEDETAFDCLMKLNSRGWRFGCQHCPFGDAEGRQDRSHEKHSFRLPVRRDADASASHSVRLPRRSPHHKYDDARLWNVHFGFEHGV